MNQSGCTVKPIGGNGLVSLRSEEEVTGFFTDLSLNEGKVPDRKIDRRTKAVLSRALNLFLDQLAIDCAGDPEFFESCQENLLRHLGEYGVFLGSKENRQHKKANGNLNRRVGGLWLPADDVDTLESLESQLNPASGDWPPGFLDELAKAYFDIYLESQKQLDTGYGDRLAEIARKNYFSRVVSTSLEASDPKLLSKKLKAIRGAVRREMANRPGYGSNPNYPLNMMYKMVQGVVYELLTFQHVRDNLAELGVNGVRTSSLREDIVEGIDIIIRAKGGMFYNIDTKGAESFALERRKQRQLMVPPGGINDPCVLIKPGETRGPVAMINVATAGGIKVAMGTLEVNIGGIDGLTYTIQEVMRCINALRRTS